MLPTSAQCFGQMHPYSFIRRPLGCILRNFQPPSGELLLESLELPALLSPEPGPTTHGPHSEIVLTCGSPSACDYVTSLLDVIGRPLHDIVEENLASLNTHLLFSALQSGNGSPKPL